MDQSLYLYSIQYTERPSLSGFRGFLRKCFDMYQLLVAKLTTVFVPCKFKDEIYIFFVF